MRTSSGNAELQQSSTMDLRKPPVVETSLGCFFQIVPGWNILHFGALWERFRNKYPNVEFPAPIMQIPESPSITVNWSPGESLIPIRALFTDNQKTQLVQLQTNLFLHNWRKNAESPTYEHYDRVFPLFKQDWQVFISFLQECNLPRPKLTRCEMTYFNHIVRGEHWSVYEDLPKLFRFWQGFDQHSVFNRLEVVAFNLVQSVGKGRVNIVVSPGVRRSDGKEILQMNVTTTRPIDSSEDKDLFEGLDECHDIALKSFKDVVTDEALKAWGEQ